MLAILGIWIKIETLSVGMRSIRIHVSGWPIVNLGTLSSIIVTGRHRQHSGQRWTVGRCWWSESVWWRCTCAFAPPVCLRNLGHAILASKAAVHVAFMNHSLVSIYHGLALSVGRKLNSPHLLFLDFRVRFLDGLLRFLYNGMWKPSFGHFGHIQGKAYVGLF